MKEKRYTIHSMHGPTVYARNDRDEIFHLLARLVGSNGGMYRVVDWFGREHARIRT